jgi:hypothetical protein
MLIVIGFAIKGKRFGIQLSEGMSDPTMEAREWLN